MGRLHDRVTLNGLCFDPKAPLAEDLATWSQAGAARFGVHTAKMDRDGWAESVRRLGEGAKVTHLVHRAMFDLTLPESWEGDRERLRRSVTAAVTLGTSVLYGTTGPSGAGGPESKGAVLREAFADIPAAAAGDGVRLAFETAPAKHAAIHFLHDAQTAVETADLTGTAVCLDCFTCGDDPGLTGTINRSVGSIALIQVNDRIGSDGPYLPPGRGELPLETIIFAALDAGYGGYFDIKLIGRPVEEVFEGAAYVGEMLDRWGVTG